MFGDNHVQNKRARGGTRCRNETQNKQPGALMLNSKFPLAKMLPIL